MIGSRKIVHLEQNIIFGLCIPNESTQSKLSTLEWQRYMLLKFQNSSYRDKVMNEFIVKSISAQIGLFSQILLNSMYY